MGHTDKFNELAASYDKPETIRLSNLASKAIAEVLNDKKNMRGIDFGCGTGLVGLQLIDRFESIVFIDASEKMIEQVDQKLKDKKITHAETLCVNIEEDQQLSIHANTVFLSLVLHHIENVENILSKLYKILDKSGQLIIVDFENPTQLLPGDNHHHGVEIDELIAILRKVGFKLNHIEKNLSKSEPINTKEASLFILEAVKSLP